MSTVFKIKLYSDPEHGWGAVKRQLLTDLGIVDKITAFSYQKGSTVYLEEDCDLPTLITALATRDGAVVEYINKHTDKRSPIRSYERYTI